MKHGKASERKISWSSHVTRLGGVDFRTSDLEMPKVNGRPNPPPRPYPPQS
jgi:hypothetical protein